MSCALLIKWMRRQVPLERVPASVIEESYKPPQVYRTKRSSFDPATGGTAPPLLAGLGRIAARAVGQRSAIETEKSVPNGRPQQRKMSLIPSCLRRLSNASPLKLGAKVQMERPGGGADERRSWRSSVTHSCEKPPSTRRRPTPSGRVMVGDASVDVPSADAEDDDASKPEGGSPEEFVLPVAGVPAVSQLPRRDARPARRMTIEVSSSHSRLPSEGGGGAPQPIKLSPAAHSTTGAAGGDRRSCRCSSNFDAERAPSARRRQRDAASTPSPSTAALPLAALLPGPGESFRDGHVSTASARRGSRLDARPLSLPAATTSAQGATPPTLRTARRGAGEQRRKESILAVDDARRSHVGRIADRSAPPSARQLSQERQHQREPPPAAHAAAALPSPPPHHGQQRPAPRAPLVRSSPQCSPAGGTPERCCRGRVSV